MTAASAPPPEEPNVKITLFVTAEERQALESLAKSLQSPPDLVMREAIALSVFIHGLLEQGNTVLYRRPDGKTGEISV